MVSLSYYIKPNKNNASQRQSNRKPAIRHNTLSHTNHTHRTHTEISVLKEEHKINIDKKRQITHKTRLDKTRQDQKTM